MSNLFVFTYKDERNADRVLQEVAKLQKQRLISVDDAAVVIHPEDQKVKLKHATSLVGPGALGGAFWGLLFGLIFFMPLAGLAIGAVTGAVAGKLADYGIDNDFIKEVSKRVSPGTSALFLLVRDAQQQKVVEALKPYDGELIRSSLSPEQEMELKTALAT